MNRAGVAVAAVVLAVLTASLAPGSTAAGLPAGTDKLLHAVGYAAIAYATAELVSQPKRTVVAGVALTVAGFGAGVEVLQPLVGRNASALDALANLVGATVGAFGWWVSRTR